MPLFGVALLAGAASLPLGIVPDPCATSVVSAYQGIDVRQTDFGGLCHYRDANGRLLKSGKRVRIVLIGDSITEGWGIAEPDFFRAGVVNRGVSGQTSPQLLIRFRQDVIGLKPAAVHIMVGTNDVAGNTGPTTLDNVVGNIRSMVELARANHIRVLLGSVLPADHFGWAPELAPASEIKELNERLAALARAENIRFVDYYSALVNVSGGLSQVDAADGVHPTSEGYSKMRRIAQRAFADVH